jgi:hypothetical protein
MPEMKTVEGQRWGWRYYKNGNNPCGDNFISFGIDHKTASDPDGLSRFERGLEDNLWLNFNVDGPILDMMVNADFQKG